MKKQFQIILATVILGLVLAVVPVQGQRLISDIREDFNGLLVQLRTIDNYCVIILGALLDEARVYVLDSRKVITVGKGNLLPLLEEALEDALLKLELAQNQIAQCFDLLGTFVDEEEVGLAALATAIAENDEIDARKRLKIAALLANAQARVTAIEDKLDDVQSDCLEGSDVEGGLEGIIGEIQSPSAEVDGVIAVPQLTETGPIPFQTLRQFKIDLGFYAATLKSCLWLIKEITKDKKWLLKAIKEVYWLLRASNFGGRAAVELVREVTRVYTISGRLVETQTGGLDMRRLTNGVYLAVTGQQVRKITVVH
jgi:hypothetical protein